ncbi:MAG TPA: hypothetical protein VGB00_17335 [Pyrinomonadaceae bacterium]
MTEDEFNQVEEKLFLDDDFLERIEIIKQQLIDSYILDQLTPREKQQFEEKFLIVPDNFRAFKETEKLREELKTFLPQSVPEAVAVSVAPERKSKFIGWKPALSAAGLFLFLALAFFLFPGWEKDVANSNSNQTVNSTLAAHNVNRDIPDSNDNFQPPNFPPNDTIALVNKSNTNNSPLKNLNRKNHQVRENPKVNEDEFEVTNAVIPAGGSFFRPSTIIKNTFLEIDTGIDASENITNHELRKYDANKTAISPCNCPSFKKEDKWHVRIPLTKLKTGNLFLFGLKVAPSEKPLWFQIKRKKVSN